MYNISVSKRELSSLLSQLLPYINGEKQVTALLTVVLLMGLSHADFDAPHLHVDPAPMEPTATVMVAASGTNINVSQVQPIGVTIGP
jgi:hypothetical protein